MSADKTALPEFRKPLDLVDEDFCSSLKPAGHGVFHLMDDLQIIELIETTRERLQAELPDLPDRLARVVKADYRTAAPGRLQEILAEQVLGLDSTRPADARMIQRKIALAEAFAPVKAGAGTGARPPSWVVQENPMLDAGELEIDARFSASLRYLFLKAEISGASAYDAAAPATAVPTATIPSRFGVELSRCLSLRRAIACVRLRLPCLKGLAAFEFLAAIGYPVAVPSPDAMRFARYVGLLACNEKAAPEHFITMVERAARLTGAPVAQVGYLLALYAGAAKIEGWAAVCVAKSPRCTSCNLSSRCRQFAMLTAAASAAPAQPARGRPIHEWSIDERPRERLLAGERLSNSELLAIILRSGSGRMSAVELGRELLHEFGTLHDLERASPQDIVTRMKGKGIGPAKAVEICAAIELGKRVSQPAADTRLGLKQVGSSRDVFEMCRTRYKAATQEEFLLLILNTKNRVQKEVPVSLGTLNSSIVHPRDVFRHALREAAAAVIFVHNHPSGDPGPSDEDILLTARLVDVGKLLGIQVLDHVIIGSHEWYSFADHGRLK